MSNTNLLSDVYDKTIPTEDPSLGMLGDIFLKAERTEPLGDYSSDELVAALEASTSENVSLAAKAHIMEWLEKTPKTEGDRQAQPTVVEVDVPRPNIHFGFIA